MIAVHLRAFRCECRRRPRLLRSPRCVTDLPPARRPSVVAGPESATARRVTRATSEGLLRADPESPRDFVLPQDHAGRLAHPRMSPKKRNQAPKRERLKVQKRRRAAGEEERRPWCGWSVCPVHSRARRL